jgi:hypothetical protein
VSPVGFDLAVWDSPAQVWETDDLTADAGQRDRGLVVPFLMRIENARSGQSYRIEINYECGAGDVSGLEFLTDYDREAGEMPAITMPGPGRPLPDAAVLMPDDSSIAADDEHGDRQFRLWGATFTGQPAGPVPSIPCAGNKSFTINFRALQDTVHLLWGAQLAAAGEGDGGGARQFGMKVSTDGQEPAEINVVVPG